MIYFSIYPSETAFRAAFTRGLQDGCANGSIPVLILTETSVMRDLALRSECYESMLYFFRASSWSLDEIRKRCFSAVKEYASLYKEGNFHVLVGDGVKQPKEGRRMPGVKKLYQESENSTKPEYVHGHMSDGLGILAGTVRNRACIPLSIRLHDGLKAAKGWKGQLFQVLLM